MVRRNDEHYTLEIKKSGNLHKSLNSLSGGPDQHLINSDHKSIFALQELAMGDPNLIEIFNYNTRSVLYIDLSFCDYLKNQLGFYFSLLSVSCRNVSHNPSN